MLPRDTLLLSVSGIFSLLSPWPLETPVCLRLDLLDQPLILRLLVRVLWEALYRQHRYVLSFCLAAEIVVDIASDVTQAGLVVFARSWWESASSEVEEAGQGWLAHMHFIAAEELIKKLWRTVNMPLTFIFPTILCANGVLDLMAMVIKKITNNFIF
jgi:hypothetical protein